MKTQRHSRLMLGMIAACVLSVCSLTGYLCYGWGHSEGRELGRLEEQVWHKIFPVTNYFLEKEGYFVTFEDDTYELKYIDGEGWFLVDSSAYPGIMRRLEVFLGEVTPDNKYTYEYYTNGYRRGIISIYFAR